MIANSMIPLVQGNSAVRAMFEKGKQMAAIYGEENVYDFSLGNPNLYPPEAVKDSIIDILNTEDPHKVHGYMSNAGFESTRKAIADNLNKRFNTDFGAKNIIMTVGAGSAINVALRTILDPGDEVIVFAPYFVEYRNYIANYHGVTIEVSPNPEHGFMPDMKEFAYKINRRTRAVIINTPNNPTGAIYPDTVIKQIGDILAAKERELGTTIYLISDEPYRELIYTDKPIVCTSKFYDDTLIAYSFSKSLSLPGERIGYLAIPDMSDQSAEFIEAATIANRICGDVNAPSLMQLTIERCLDEKVDIDYYKKNAEDLYDIVTSAGFECVKPEGAFYLWMKSPVPNEKRFVEAAEEEHIILVPGSSFAGPGNVRLSFCVSHEMIERSRDAFMRLGEKYFK
ncbi:MAG: pyridoxal phosphate-dependent aminotransferase [Eubacterium sp.]|jgi:aspartate aminotransferase|nr:pyridoxal phosphate-dependent aminotransferase [Eubacterium sp.]MCI2197135.1 pyridoxal phosphate-dependent aminotransferase [Eubacterium sp.]